MVGPPISVRGAGETGVESNRLTDKLTTFLSKYHGLWSKKFLIVLEKKKDVTEILSFPTFKPGKILLVHFPSFKNFMATLCSFPPSMTYKEN
jgi:hypothetical protein